MSTPTLPSAIQATIVNNDLVWKQQHESSPPDEFPKIQPPTEIIVTSSILNKDDDNNNPPENLSSREKQEEQNFFNDVILPHVALVFVPILASVNTTLSRASFVYFDESKGQQPLKPFTLAICRTIISTFIFYFLRSQGWFANSNETEKSSSEEQNEHHVDDDDTATTRRRNLSVKPRLEIQPLEDPLTSTATVIDYLEVFVLGFFGIAVNFICFFRGIAATNNVTASAFMSLVPSIVFIIGVATGNESVTILKILSTVLLWAGNCFTAEVWRLFSSASASDKQEGASSSFDTSYYIGIFYLLVNQLSFSSYLVFQKPILNKKKFDFISFMFLVMGSGLVGLLFLSLFSREHEVTGNLFSGGLAPISFVAIVYAGVIQSSVTYFLLAFGIARSKSPLLAAIVNNAQPGLVVIEAVWFLDETLNQNQIIGGVIIGCGVVLSIYASVMKK